jgi:superfamily I DNA/RNA helicase
VALRRALDQFNIPASSLPWVRTIHSAAFRLLRLDHDHVLDADNITEFARLHGYKLTIEGRGIDDPKECALARGRTADDQLMFAYEWGRNHRLDPERTLARCPVEGLSVSKFRLFARRLEGFKRERGLLDFVDILQCVLDRGLRPDVDVAMVDEAHDLSPLQIAVVEAWFAPCKRSFVCADDDQAIFGWHGASPDWIRAISERCESEVLETSHRVPRRVHALAQKIIARNRVRMPKRYWPADREGRVVRCGLDQALGLVAASPSAFVLVRNRKFIRRIAAKLVERVVPFRVVGWGGTGPLDDPRAARAVQLVWRLRRGESGPFPTSQVAALLSLVPTSTGLVPKGVVDHVRALRGHGAFMRSHLIEQHGLVELLHRVDADGVELLRKLPREWRRYFAGLHEQFGRIPEHAATVTTIHVAKGDERDLVVVIPDMTRQTYAAYLRGGSERNEGENRAFYVAITRTRETLVLVQPLTKRYFEFPTVDVDPRDVADLGGGKRDGGPA